MFGRRASTASAAAPSLALSTAVQAGAGDLFDRLAAGLDTLIPLVPTSGAALASARPPRGAARALLAATPGAGTPATADDAVDWLLAGATAEAADLGADDAAGELPRAAPRAAALAAVRPPLRGRRGGGARGVLRSLLRRHSKDEFGAAGAAAPEGEEGEEEEEEEEAALPLDVALARALKKAGKSAARAARAEADDRAAMEAAYADDIRAYRARVAADARKARKAAGVKTKTKKRVGWADGFDDAGGGDGGGDDAMAPPDDDDDDDDDGGWAAVAAADAELAALADEGAAAAEARAESEAAAAAHAAAVEARERNLATKSYFDRAAAAARKRKEALLLGPDPADDGGPTADTVTTRAEDTAATPTVPTDVRLPTAAKLAAADVAAARRGLAKGVARPGEGANDAVAGASLVARGLWARRPPPRGARLLGAILPAKLPLPDVMFGIYASSRDAADALKAWAGRDGAPTAADPAFAAAAVAAAARARLSVMAFVPRAIPAADLAAGLGDAMADGAAKAAAAAFRADVVRRQAALRVGALPPLPSRADVEHLDWPCLAPAAGVADAGRALAANLAAAAARAAAAGGEGWVDASGTIPAGTRFRAAATPGDAVIVEAFPAAPGGGRGRAVLVARGPRGSATALFTALIGPGAADAVASRNAASWLAFAVNAALPGATAWLPGFNPAKTPGALDVLSAAAARFRLGGGVPTLVGRGQGAAE